MTNKRHPELLWLHDVSGAQIGPISDTNDLMIETVLGGAEVLSFVMSREDERVSWLSSDRKVLYNGSFYRVGRTTDNHKDSTLTVVECPALWYDLSDNVHFGPFVLSAATTRDGLESILNETGWSIGEIEDETLDPHSYQKDSGTVLEILRAWALVCGYEVSFDTLNKEISFRGQVGDRKGIGFIYGRNVTEVERVYSPPVATRIWAVGANDLGISGVSIDGKPYVEDFSWYTSQGIGLEEARAEYLKEVVWKDDRYIEATGLLDAATAKIQELSRPVISYSCSVVDLSSLTNVDEGSFSIGDIVRVHDQELDVDIETRVVRKVVRPNDPSKNVVELSYYRPGISLESLSTSAGGYGGGGGGDFDLFVDECESSVISASPLEICSISVTVAGISNGILGAHFVGVATGSGTLRVEVLIDGSTVGGQELIPFTNGQTIQSGIPTWYASLGEGTHFFSLRLRVVSGSGTVSVSDFAGRLYAMVSGTLGGGTGGAPYVTISDEIQYSNASPTDSLPVIEFVPDITRVPSESVSFISASVTDSITVLIV